MDKIKQLIEELKAEVEKFETTQPSQTTEATPEAGTEEAKPAEEPAEQPAQ